MLFRSRTSSRSDLYLLRLGSFRQAGVTTNGRVRLRQEVSFFANRGDTDLDLVYDDARSLAELAAGNEERSGRRVEIYGRRRVSPAVDLTARGERSRDRTSSDTFASRRFDLRVWRVVPGVAVRATARATVRGSADVAWKTDRDGDRSARLVRMPVSLRVARSRRMDAVVRAEIADVAVSGVAAGLAAFELTDGRGDGRSYLWGLTVQGAITGSLRATLAYDGRAPSSGPVIHTGRFQLSAVC